MEVEYIVNAFKLLNLPQMSNNAGGIAKSTAGYISSSLTWCDLKWIREVTSLPIVIKGIQTVEDAVLAHEHNADGIVLSNHGGRSQDTYILSAGR